MYRAAWKSLLYRRARLILSTLSVVLGVAFVAGSFIFTNMLSSVFDGIMRGTVADVNVNPVGTYTDEAASAAGQNASPSQVPLLTVAQVQRFESVDGVRTATGTITTSGAYLIGSNGKVIVTGEAPGIASNWFTDPAYGGGVGIELTSGSAPAGDDQIAIDERTLSASGYHLGEQMRVALPDGTVVSKKIVGTAQWGGGGTVGATYVFFSTSEAQRLLLGGRTGFTGAWITATSGTDIPTLVTRVQAVVPDQFEAVSGVTAADFTATQVNKALSFINTFLLVFAAIALLVASFLIVNTFSIIVAQRGRELALFRAMGASRRQVSRTVLLEAAVIGFAGSSVGLLMGWGLAFGIKALFGVLGIDLGDAAPTVPVRAVIAAYAVGMIVTMTAAWLPARKAGRVPPVAAMSGEAMTGQTGFGVRAIIGTSVAVLGAGAMAVGLWADVPRQTLVIGIGCGLLLLGVAGASPVIGRPVVAGVGFVYRKVWGEVGRLAELNSLRQPRRTAATASALMLSLALVTTLSVLGASASKSIHEVVDQSLRGDFTVKPVTLSGSLPKTLQADLEKVPGVERVDGFGMTGILLGDSGEPQGGVAAILDPSSFNRIVEQTLVTGSLDSGTNTVLVDEEIAKSKNLRVGSKLTTWTPVGKKQVELTVSGIVSSPKNAKLGDYMVSQSTGTELGWSGQPAWLVVSQRQGADAAAVRADLDKATASLPTVAVLDNQEYAEQLTAQVDQLLNMIYALLGLAIVIAVLGIVNTLALSVIERTREIGLLRAIGVTRPQLRRMITLESVIIALLGSVLGVALGVAFGAALQHALADSGLDRLVLPWEQLALYLVAAVVVGVVAALWPARRAARLDLLQAIATE